MTTLEKIRVEIEHWESDDTQDEYQMGAMDMQNYVLRVIDKYAEQEPSRDMEEIAEIMKCDADAETKCKMISNILTAKPHYFAEQEPCDDVVSRQAVIDAIDKWVKNMHILVVLHTNEVTPLFDSIHKLPSIRPLEPKTGHWIVWDTSSYDWTYKCDKCGSIGFKQSNYCPNCGVKMVKPTCDTCKYNTAAFMPCNACKDKSEYKLQESEDEDKE